MIMSPTVQEPAAPSTIITTGQAQPTTGPAQLEFSEEYSKGELEGVSSRELLGGYAD